MNRHYDILIDGEWIDTGRTLDVVEKHTGETFATVSQASRVHVAQAVEAAQRAFETSALTPYRRYEILRGAADRLADMADEAALNIAREAGKPLRDARVEVERACRTLLISAEEAKRIRGEMIPVDAQPGSEGRLAFTIRSPLGVVAAITPFNFPLNLVCHKVGPALAAGNTVVLKPASHTPLSAVLLCRLLAEAGLPPGHLNLVPGPGKATGEALLKDERVRYYSFTGSAEVGRRIQQVVAPRPVTLELGGNSATLICEDADLQQAAQRCAVAGFGQAGQVCIAVQRILVHREVLPEFEQLLLAATEALVVGDPTDPATDVGPLIDMKEADRVGRWVDEAVRAGARALIGGRRSGATFEPTILVDVDPSMRVVREEVFAPVVTLQPFDSLDQAIAMANDSRFGLQAAVFTQSLETAMTAVRRLQAGGVIVNDTPAYRADQMPYGGIKESGVGREGPRYAIESLTELKTVVIDLKGSSTGGA